MSVHLAAPQTATASHPVIPCIPTSNAIANEINHVVATHVPAAIVLSAYGKGAGALGQDSLEVLDAREEGASRRLGLKLELDLVAVALEGLARLVRDALPRRLAALVGVPAAIIPRHALSRRRRQGEEPQAE